MIPILALDPGLSCGWCYRGAGGDMESGMWDLKAAGPSLGARMARLEDLVDEALRDYKPRLLVYEAVHHHHGVDAAHVYGSITGVAALSAFRQGIRVEGLAVATIKTFATRKPHASKADMRHAARDRWGLELPHDEADARWIAEACAAEVRAALGGGE